VNLSGLWSLVLLAADYPDATNRVGSGVISGGWGYVWAAYAITWSVLAFYGLSVWIRRPRTSAKKVQP
jgi:hypothetical protein